MKLSSSNLLSVLGILAADQALAVCSVPETTVAIDSGFSKLSVSNYVVQNVLRFSSAVPGSKLILKDYSSEPVIAPMGDGVISISAGGPCLVEDDEEPSSSAKSLLTSISPLVMAHAGVISPLTAVASFLLISSPFAAADPSSTITIEIYEDVDERIHESEKSMTCPPESFYFEHHPTVYSGYSGCVGEKYLLPCGQDAQGADDPGLYAKTPINYDSDTNSCVTTGYSYETRTFWILWGDPLDKHELLTRTGFLPTVKLPLLRGPYPGYSHGTDETDPTVLDDTATAKAVSKDFLVYLGAMKESDRDNWYVSMTEGAEQGIQILWAAKALEIAQTTCNRDIYVLMEAPAYGYSDSEIARWVNSKSGSFYNSEECLCFTDSSCNFPSVSINKVGFFPTNPLPVRTGGDGIDYVADSTDTASPWMESMVFPENPSGAIKTPRLPANRRVCDGVYVWPMYFYFNDFKVPTDDIPECSGWAYAITKGYSASVRAGFITYKKDPKIWVDAVSSMADTTDSIGHGIYSEWTWMGQMQIQQLMMSRPLSDPTSWVGAYSEIMKEKWDVIEEGFANCPVLTLTNPGKGAYAFFVYKAPYLGIQDSFISSFFLDVLGVKATTYNWGFRGADPSTYYGDGVGNNDFTRLQLYRDVNVYMEVARRAKIVCADTSASIGDFISIDDWANLDVAVSGGDGRRKLKVKDDVRKHMPHLTEKQISVIEYNQKEYRELDAKAAACAPEYTTRCLFKTVGRRFEDIDHHHGHNVVDSGNESLAIAGNLRTVT